ncbi:hypothetical protein EJB05_20962 [Eragrostis curvula]|uniref:DUF3615 domain-containing protein n=1 Tax=Eragrostis curvula TaxID=38414 RepID=A0A5J9V1N5_9POAL|nr:hypothetical protein EJB05_20962 [Eragrostis curvula]
MVPRGSKPAPPPSPREEREPTPSRQTLTCAELAVEHYMNQAFLASENHGDEHELVEAVASSAFNFNGIWVHVNFLAKEKGAAGCVGLSPSFFFAEVKGDNKGFSCVSCVKMDSGNPRDLGGCRMCPHKILHPAAGGYRTAQPIQKVAARKKCVIVF